MSIIVFDPGHCGTPDPGAMGPNGTRESDIALSVCYKAQALLEAYGHTVVLTRTQQDEPETDDLSVRTDLSNEEDADVFVSVHCNSFGNPTANGTQTFYYRGSSNGSQLAQIVQGYLVDAVGLRDRGTAEAGFYVLRYSDAVAILVELAFISNPDEEAILTDDEKQNLFAKALADGIIKYLG